MPAVMKEYQTLVFFKSELKDTKKHVEEKGQQKHKRPETGKWNWSGAQTVLTYTQAFLA